MVDVVPGRPQRPAHYRRAAALGPAVGRSAGRHRVPAAARRPLPLHAVVPAVAVAAAVLVGAGVLLTHRTATPAQPAPVSADATSDAAAHAWLADSLPTGSRILVDRVNPPAGFPAATVASAGQTWRSFDYLVTVETGTSVPSDSVVASVWPSSVPVALFERLQVRQIEGDVAPQELVRRQRSELADRVRAGVALSANPGITVTEQVADRLQRGEVDLRVTAVLSALAAVRHVTVDTVSDVPAEAAAGTPSREVTVYVTDPAPVTRQLGALGEALRPDQVTVRENGAIRLHWPLSSTPVPAVK
ncbi:hypothetical protein LV457_01670 [Mycobacterium sp. MYCO198283]|uniref:hypothetical protein n=1 Tax=Mycobacterium sp. MYCO198283 TaxID=2883505 RepID=UPI001E60AF53|nr:hypothetical protein [Mycobacterium sp. MYCO198283]MCG5431006.1 hypothetical protein [Mycobacterium sp. MYCO198283]